MEENPSEKDDKPQAKGLDEELSRLIEQVIDDGRHSPELLQEFPYRNAVTGEIEWIR